jgi:hypothetical protein
MLYIILRGHWYHIIVLNIHTKTEDKTDDVKDSFYKELESKFDKLPKYHMNIEVLYNILIECGVPMKLVRLIKVCLNNETYSKVRIGKHLSDNCPNQNGLKQGDVYRHCPLTLL